MDNSNYFQIFKDEAGEYRFRLRDSGNHEILTTSEGYKNKQDCIDSARSVNVATPITFLLDD